MVIGIILLTIFGLYLFIICPSYQKQEAFKVFKNYYYAHRGLHDDKSCENSMAAFKKAIEGGFGIELDVQITRDKQVVVIHDFNLLRTFNLNVDVDQVDYEQIRHLKLFGSEHTMPLFSEVLKLVDGRVPLVVEIKQKGGDCECVSKVCEQLAVYSGLFCVESFNPFALVYIKKHYKEWIRGQLSSNFIKERANLSLPNALILTFLLSNILTRPHFIAYDVKYKEQLSFGLCTKLLKANSVLWTINNIDTFKLVKDNYHSLIFEGFNPFKY